MTLRTTTFLYLDFANLFFPAAAFLLSRKAVYGQSFWWSTQICSPCKEFSLQSTLCRHITSQSQIHVAVRMDQKDNMTTSLKYTYDIFTTYKNNLAALFHFDKKSFPRSIFPLYLILTYNRFFSFLSKYNTLPNLAHQPQLHSQILISKVHLKYPLFPGDQLRHHTFSPQPEVTKKLLNHFIASLYGLLFFSPTLFT